MGAHGTHFRGLLADDDVAAVGALPNHVAVPGEDQALLQVLHQLEVALLVLLLNFGHALEQIGDVVKALSAGANSVMVGSLLAGTEESPGETILYQGRTYKIYRGMGSIDAMKEGSSDRYFQQKSKKLVPEGIVGRVPFRGLASETIYQLVGGVRSGMGYCGAATIQELFEKSQMVEISAAGLRESHVHDVIITKEAPNYRVDNA